MRRSPEMNKGNKLSLLAYDFTLFDAWLLPPANVDNSSSMVEEIMTQAFFTMIKFSVTMLGPLSAH